MNITSDVGARLFGGVREHDGPRSTPSATPPTIASGNDVIPPTSAAVSASSRRLGPSATLTSLARWLRTGAASSALTAASDSGEDPDLRGHRLHPDPGERRRARVVGGGAHGEAEARALEQEREHDDDERHRDEHDELVAADDEVADVPAVVDGRGEGDGQVDLRELELQEQDHLRDADRSR